MIVRSPIDIAFFHHVNGCDVVQHPKLERAELMKTRQDRWFDRVLQKVNDHEDEAVAGDGAVAGVVDIVVMSPELHDQGQGTETPVNCAKRGLIRYNASS